MKKRIWIISILTLLVSVCSGWAFSLNHEPMKVNAAAADVQDAKYLIGNDNKPYLSNVVVGKTTGAGEYVVGAEEAMVTATAEENFQLVGWYVEYNDEENNAEYEYIDASRSSYVLKDKDEIEYNATITSTGSPYINSGSFKLDTVFEDLTIRPVFDHIYYSVDVSSLMLVTELNKEENVPLSGDGSKYILHYTSKDETSTPVEYSNACYEYNGKAYYIGTLYYDSSRPDAEKYYTKHKRYDVDGTEEEISFEKGVLRINENFKFDYNVLIDSADIKKSQNIDLKGISISANNSTEMLNKVSSLDSTLGYVSSSDENGRTTGYSVNFNVKKSSDYKNTISLNYHKLYVVDLVFHVDGALVDNADIINDIVGTIKIVGNTLSSNVTVKNYYSKLATGWTFLMKNANDNGTKSFTIDYITNISKNGYQLYTLDKVNSNDPVSTVYSSISKNQTIVLDYVSTKYKVNYVVKELIGENLVDMASQTTLEPGYVVRGKDLSLSFQSSCVEDLTSIGYQFEGFASTQSTEIERTKTVAVDSDEPTDQTVYLCYSKIEYSLKVSGYNSIKIGKSFALNSLKVRYNYDSLNEETVDNSATEDVLNKKVKVGSVVELFKTVNSGFSVKLVLKSDSVDDISGFTLNKDELDNYTISYSQYEWSNDSDWEKDWSELYLKIGSDYVLNTSSEHDEDTDYYYNPTIEIFVKESYNYYSLRYFIKPVVDAVTKEVYTMGRIDAIVYREMITSQDSWETDKANLYINNNGSFEKVADDANYNSETNYYIQITTGIIKNNYYLASTSQDSWDTDKANLYVNNNGSYEKVAIDADYDSETNYFIKIEDTLEILISDLLYSDVVLLKSEAKLIEEGEDVYYVFSMFTKDDGKSKLTYTHNNSGKLDTITETIKNSSEIQVKYSVPKTNVSILVPEEFSDFDFTTTFESNIAFNVKDEGNEFEITFYTSYDEATAIITFAPNLGQIGYKLLGCSDNDNTNYNDVDDSKPGMQIELNIKSGDMIQLTLNIELIKYKFVFSSDLDDDITKELTIKELSAEIEKPKGYYVSKIRFNSYENNDLNLTESNDGRINGGTKCYHFNLQTIENLKNIVNNYTVNNVVPVSLTYEMYEYTVKVGFNIGELGVIGNNEPFPFIRMQYENSSGETVTEVKGDGVCEFKLPYNAKAIVFSMVENGDYGLSSSGIIEATRNFGKNEITTTTNSLSLTSICDDIYCTYLMSYETYTLKVVSNMNSQTPTVTPELTNGMAGIVRGSEISIISNAKRLNGIQFDSIIIKTNYRVYSDSSNWNDVWDKLYVKDDRGRYSLNTIDVYDENIEYYEKAEHGNYFELKITTPKQYVNNSLSYDYFDSKINIADYFLTDGEYIEIELNYATIDFKLNNNTPNVTGIYGASWKLSEVGNLNIDLNDIASFDFKVNGGEADDSTKIKIGDTIRVEFKLNSNVKNGENEEYFDLTKGLTISKDKIKINGKDLFNKSVFNFVNGQGYIEFTFVSDYVSTAENDNKITIDYTFFIESRTIEVTTIAGDNEAFYSDILYSINSLGGSEYSESSVAKFKPSDQQFLSYLTVGCGFILNNGLNHEDYFEIYGVDVYKKVGTNDYQRITSKSELEDLGVGKFENKEVAGTGYENGEISLRLIESIKLVFKVKPVIRYKNGSPVFQMEFKCDINAIGQVQSLTVGNFSNDIILDGEIGDYLNLTYFDEDGNIVNNGVTNVGKYSVELKFIIPEYEYQKYTYTTETQWNNDYLNLYILDDENYVLNTNSTFDDSEEYFTRSEIAKNKKYLWLNNYEIEDVVSIVVYQKELKLEYDTIANASKEYDDKSTFGLNEVLKYFRFRNNKSTGEVNVDYETLLNGGGNQELRLKESNIKAFITTGGVEGEIWRANDAHSYRLHISNFLLPNSKNFKLVTTEFDTNPFIKITRKKVELSEIEIFDKVLDKIVENRANAEIKNLETITAISGLLNNDKVEFDFTKLVARFENAHIGDNNVVLVNASDVMFDDDAGNYYIEEIRISGVKVYPYELVAKIDGVGEIKLFNERGLTEKDKVDLIPINATLSVVEIYEGDEEYKKIFNSISSYLNRRNEYAIGYKLMFNVGGSKTEINKSLHLSMPIIEKLSGVYFVTDGVSGKVNVDGSTGVLIVDLSQIDKEIDSFILTTGRVFLEAWQIVLIVVLSVLSTTAVVLSVILIRRHKRKSYSVHDKI